MADIHTMDTQLNNLPYSLEAEQSVLGGLLLDPECISTVLEYITKADMFYRQQHRDLFAVFLNMFNSSKTIDFITVLDESIRAEAFDSQESAKLYLVSLMELVPTTANILEYCRIVQEKYYIRTLIIACSEIADRASDGDIEAKQLLDLAEQRIYDIRQGKDASALTKIDTVIIEAYDRLVKLTGEDKDQYLGLPTGFSSLDYLISGLNKSDLILVAARPGMGKTSFALNIATNVALKSKKDVAVFSLEMSNEQLVTRVLSSEARIKSEQLRKGTLSGDEWVKLATSAEVLSKTNMYLDDTAGITVAEMKAKLRRLRNLGLVVIDYLQLMSSGKRTENRVQEISQMTRNLKIMAKELNVPVILLSQLSRAAEQRQGHRPMLSDLRDSGSIEQDADIVLFLYREGYYEEDVENKCLAQCIVAKNRHGSTGDVDIRWIGEYTRFESLELLRDEPF
ncbi:replicative DNA helicase [Paludicola sp. MB14-C6]|uniref:replicative DNA helicase n=1 Tax=Paludihabitans sp. MB14-C6 TaxID=3070656 RepID=UPI0027DCB9BF|nr:replicative DNA helicase [Paludicola sp. MB14-C6]WMJ24129.1 replicative DNA helicase [Paludicola sp. MB14-C6]